MDIDTVCLLSVQHLIWLLDTGYLPTVGQCVRHVTGMKISYLKSELFLFKSEIDFGKLRIPTVNTLFSLLYDRRFQIPYTLLSKLHRTPTGSCCSVWQLPIATVYLLSPLIDVARLWFRCLLMSIIWAAVCLSLREYSSHGMNIQHYPGSAWIIDRLLIGFSLSSVTAS